LQENTTISLSTKEVSQILGIYFSQKLRSPTPTELKILVTNEGVNFEVKLWIEKKLLEVLELD
jgi:hypothetical protein